MCKVSGSFWISCRDPFQGRNGRHSSDGVLYSTAACHGLGYPGGIQESPEDFYSESGYPDAGKWLPRGCCCHHLSFASIRLIIKGTVWVSFWNKHSHTSGKEERRVTVDQGQDSSWNTLILGPVQILILYFKSTRWDRQASQILRSIRDSQQGVKGDDPLFLLFFQVILLQVARVVVLGRYSVQTVL